MRSRTEWNSIETISTWIPRSLRSAWIIVAIFDRWALEALLMIVNSTGTAAASTRVPSCFQEKPADCNKVFAFGTDRAGWGTDAFTQRLLPGVTGDQSGVPRPR